MINEFIDDVTSQGAEALLPQNLSDDWLEALYAASVDFLRTAAADKPPEASDEEMFEDEESMILLTAVVEILQHQGAYHSDMRFDEGELFEPISCYALSIVFEYLARKVQMEIDPPTLENILDRDRVIDFEENHPEVTAALNMLVGGEEGGEDHR